MLTYRFEGDRFEGRVLLDSSALPGTPMRPHSVVTLHLIDREGEPTRAAVEEIMWTSSAENHADAIAEQSIAFGRAEIVVRCVHGHGW